MMNLSQKLIKEHLLSGSMNPGEEIGLKIDQTLMQDATGTMVMLEFESLGFPRVKTEVSVQYVDHNLLQTDFRNADDHIFLRSACRRFGIWYSRAGNGVSHPVHMERFGKPGKTLLGSDSHTCSGGSMAMLAIGAGGLEVAVAMAGEPFFVKMPLIHGVKLVGKLPRWVGAKDIILELLRRHGVKGGVGRIFEYFGPGLATLSAMDRHTIANMGAEMGATTSVFPSDANLRRFLDAQGRGGDWRELTADDGAGYDEVEELDLSQLEPLIALPGSPGNVVTVASVAGTPIGQSYIGSSANPGLRDLGIAAMIVAGKRVDDRVSLDINPASRQVLQNLTAMGLLQNFIAAGGRIHQAGCNGCIGMGQAPASGAVSLRTVPRNFPGRSGTKVDKVYLCGPETAAVSALTGVITDPRTLGDTIADFTEPTTWVVNPGMFIAPDPAGIGSELAIGPNIKPLPDFAPIEATIQGPVLLKTGDNVSTDDILPAGAKILPFRSNIPEISKFTFSRLDESFYDRAQKVGPGGFLVVGGENYGQGSSREHAAIAPRFLGLRAVVAKSFARIHWQNLVNFGMLPLTFANAADYDAIDQGDMLTLEKPGEAIRAGSVLAIVNTSKNRHIEVKHVLTPRQIEAILSGSLIGAIRNRR